MSDRDYKQVIIVRKDLKMRMGKCAAQVAHASLAAVLHNREHPDVIGWLNQRFVKVVVYVNSEEELLNVHNKATEAGLITELIEDAGFTEFNGVPTFTCVSVGPHKKEVVDTITGGLPLL